MKAVVWHDVGKISVDEVPDPVHPGAKADVPSSPRCLTPRAPVP